MADRSVKVYLKGDISDYNRAMLEAEGANKSFGKSLDSSNDRMSNLVQSSLALGPALVPISAAAIPAIAGLSNELGIAAVGAGVAALAFHGIGTALKAVNDYAIDPTDAHLKALNKSLDAVGPAGANFVNFLQSARPEIQKLQQLAGAGLFPGLEEGMKNLGVLGPQVDRIITSISFTLGELSSKAGASLAGPEFKDFFDFLERTGRPTLVRLGETVGNLVKGLASLWVAFEPLSNQFSQSFLSMSDDFAKWAAGLDKTQGFQDFIAYVEKSGPEVAATLASLGNALLQIVTAAAPVGSVVLPVIKSVSDAIATLAGSDLGPVIIGIVSLTAALSRMKAIGVAANGGALGTILGKSAYAGTLTQAKALPGALLAVESAAERANTKAGALSATSLRLGASLKGTAKLAGLGGGMAFAMSGLDEKMGLTNTTTLALAGSFLGPWGIAVGGGIGLTKDLADSSDGLWKSLKQLQSGLDSNSGSLTDQINALAEARNKVADFKKEVEGSPGNNPFEAFKGAKNSIEGIFGKSDVEEAQGALDKATATFKKNERAAQDLAFSEAGLSGQMLGASDAARKEAAAILAGVDAKNKAIDAANNAFSAETNYRQALKDAYAQGKTNNAGIEGNSKAALANREKISALSGAWEKLAASGTETRKSLAQARDNFIQVATAMGVPLDVARALARQLLNIPKNVKPTVTVLDKASDTITTIIRKLNKLNGKVVTTTIRTNTVTGKSTSSSGGRTATNQADGGYISGPGTGRSDSIPAWLSNGEFVVNAAATRRNLGLLHSLNAQKFADGGYAWASKNRDPAGLADSNLEWARHASKADLKWAIQAWQKVLDKNTEKLSALRDTMKSFSDTVRDNFRTNGFNQADPSTGTTGLAALGNTLVSDTTRATQFALDLKRLKSKGISAGLYNALAASGDLTTADELAAKSKSGIDYYDKLYLGRQRATSALGAQAGTAAYGKQIEGYVSEIRGMRKDIHEFKTELKKGVKDGIQSGMSSAASASQNRSGNSVKGR